MSLSYVCLVTQRIHQPCSTVRRTAQAPDGTAVAPAQGPYPGLQTANRQLFLWPFAGGLVRPPGEGLVQRPLADEIVQRAPREVNPGTARL